MKRDIHAEDYKSKSQLKREAQALQSLAQDLVALERNLLKKLPLPEYLFDAIIAAQTMKQGALKRQVLYVGRLLREEETLDLALLQRALALYLK
jgi:ribosome-associated protein